MTARPVDRAFQSMRMRDVLVLAVLVALSSGSLLAHNLEKTAPIRPVFAEASAP